ncbi:MAG: UDP-glucose 4-epimerase GalE [Nanoarchaeota archaeon]
MKKILVLGGAGYIGSVATKMLCDEGYNVTVLDNLSKGVRELVDKRAKFIQADLLDKEALDVVFQEGFDGVMHFAALKAAGESMEKPELYSNNIIGSINVLNAMVKHNVKKLIFSSSAAVYGNPQKDYIDEEHPLEPINYYGFTKLEMERIMKWYSELKGISCVALRYFNVAGDGGLKYADPNAQNIFPIIAEAITGKREKVVVFGDDYETRDGTGIRDYIHVIDLVKAHIKALELDCSFEAINLGTKTGQTVLELIDEFSKASQKEVPHEIGPRRAGDPGCLIALSDKANNLLGWKAELGLKEMVGSTWDAYNK